MTSKKDFYEIDALLSAQVEYYHLVKNELRNFKKDSADRKKGQGVFRATKSDYFEKDYLNAFVDQHLEAYANIQSAMERTFPPPSTHAAATVPTANINLPKLSIPECNGGKDWTTFYDSFKASIHNNSTLSASQKFQYLKCALNGEAALLIQHIDISDDNYAEAWRLLVDTYNDKRSLFMQHLDQFSSQPVIKTESSSELKQLLNVSKSTLNAIEKLGVESSKDKHIFVYFVLKKLPTETREFCERAFSATTSIPTWGELCNALTSRIKILEAVYGTKEDAHSFATKIKGSKSNQGSSSASNTTTNINRKKTKSFHVSTAKSYSCPLCSDSHVLRRCPLFLKMSTAERKSSVDRLKLCYNCLGFNHTINKCSSSKNCNTCGSRHHTLIHVSKSNSTEADTSSSTNSSTSTDNNNESTSAALQPPARSQLPVNLHINEPPYGHRLVLLQTAIIQVRSASGLQIPMRALLDPGSHATFITKRAATRLGLSKEEIQVEISALGGVKPEQSRHYVSIEIGSRYQPEFSVTTDALILTSLTDLLPAYRFKPGNWPHLTNLKLADPKYNEPQHIDILLGSDICAIVNTEGLKRGMVGQPTAQNTVFGWVVYGTAVQSNMTTIRLNNFQTTINLDTLLLKFMELEDVQQDRTSSAEEKWSEEFFKDSHRRQSNGKYLVRLPLKTSFDSSAIIGRSKQMAMNRFFQLERRLHQDPDLFRSYSDCIHEYLELGQMYQVYTSEEQYSKITKESLSMSCCYLPHHPVIKESSSTTKLRIVFDASAKTSNGKALNDILTIGPALQNDLSAVLLNWRLLRVVFIADIEKMYRRIDMHTDDSQYQRILWRNHPNEPLQTFALKTVTFGTASAPFTAIRVMHQLADDEHHRFPLVSDVLKNQMYVDDVLSGSDDVSSAVELQGQLIQALKSGGFELRKWSSNSRSLLETIPVEHQAQQSSLHINSEESIKTLGIFWHPVDDKFHIKLAFEPVPRNFTKRIVLSTVARLFDPLGWLNPIVVTAKIFMKRLWNCKLDWDDPLPADLINPWQNFIDDLPALNSITIPRWMSTTKWTKSYELHLFCDGSMQAYSAVAYLRCTNDDRIFSTNLLMAKCKVTPVKQITIPRIELCGATLAIKLFRFIRKNLRIPAHQTKCYFWTDSTIVLSWLNGDPNRWKTFVSNRVHDILSDSNINQWHHVVSEENPADCSSRGITIREMSNHKLWWTGPPWLKLPRSEWPDYVIDIQDSNEEDAAELKGTHVLVTQIEPSFIIHRYQPLHRLLRIVAWLSRFAYNCKTPQHHRNISSQLTVCELEYSLLQCCRLVQTESFSEEIAHLQNQRQLSGKSKLSPFNPFLDAHNILRVGGRLKNAPIRFDEKHPILLPNSHHFTDLVIMKHHLETLHGGIELTGSHIRHQFWIIHSRKAVRRVIHKCVTCFRNKPNLMQQQMAPLPMPRVTPEQAFASTGIDYAGPFDIRTSKGRGNKSYKGYIAIFICLVTKAIHLEAASDLTTNTFKAALFRFLARRGCCSHIYSDNGTNFIGAKNNLEKEFRSYHQGIEQDILPHLTAKKIQWHFNPPSSPHFGGLWEAGVKSVKFHLKRILNNTTLTFEEMLTVLTQVESCLNSRPLCPMSNDPNDVQVLTPGHFLIHNSLLAAPRLSSEPIDPLNRWQHVQMMVQHFWRRWSTEYLSRLQTRPKWLHKQRDIKINDIVIIKEENLPPNQWLLGRIVDTHPGTDQLVRVVTIKTKNGYIKRPIVKICLLPIPDNEFGHL